MAPSRLVEFLRLWQFLKMDRIRVYLSSVMAFALLSSTPFGVDAAELSSVKVRASDKSDYSRIVFDWQKLPQYSVQQQATSLVIKFSGQADFVKGGGSPEDLARVAGYKVISPDTVEIDFAKGANVRHFVIDNRLVVDIKGEKASEKSKSQSLDTKSQPQAQAQSQAQAGTPLSVTPDKITGGKPQEAAKIEAAAGESKEDKAAKEGKAAKAAEPAPVAPVSAASAAPSADEAKVPVQGESSADVPSISQSFQAVINSTVSVPVAAFVRNGFLWVVEDRPDVKVPPQVSGGDAGAFQRIPQDGVSVFRLPVPQDAKLSAIGGGLIWKVDVGPNVAVANKAVDLRRLFGEDAKDGGPSMMWPAQSLHRIVEIQDPDSGDRITVGIVNSAKDNSGDEHRYVDFTVLAAPIGFAAVAKVDDLKISKIPEGILIGRPEGLTLSSDKDILTATEESPAEGNKETSRIFDFPAWKIGTEKELSDNQRLMISGMGDQTETKKAETLLNLARLMLSFGYAPESLGYLELAQTQVPELDSNPEYICLRGAARALSWRQKEGFQDFSSAGVQDIGEVAYWKAYTLAKLDDWQQAAKIFPQDVSVFANYPDGIRNPFALTLAEVALREGNIPKAKKILDMLSVARKIMPIQYASAYDYLIGELDRQTGKKAEAKKIWKKLTEGQDDLYRAKARFALTMLQLSSKEITADKGIDNLEGLRYAWRGDDLEVSINFNLAKIYLEKGEPVKALTLMKLAHSLNPTSEQGKKIDVEMRDIFKSLFAADKINALNPVDVLTVYNEFADLIPPGAEGEALTRQLADRLASADLLPRAITLLKKQVDSGELQGLEASTVASRLAALEIADGRADEALQTLDKAEGFLKGLPVEQVLPKQQDIGLLRAKAYSLSGKPDDAFSALSLLPQDDNALRLRADIAWKGKKWQDAADALQQLVQNQNISLTRPLSDEQADMILNWAVALYLADNRYVLANVRERFSDAMAATPKAQKFDVVTRPRQAALLADRETINSIIDETVIFKDFLKSFKAGDPVPAKQAAQGAAPVEPSSATEAYPEGQPKAAEIPESLRNVPGIRADDVLGD